VTTPAVSSSLPRICALLRLTGCTRTSLGKAFADTHATSRDIEFFLFGEEGYVDPTNVLGKLPCFGYRLVRQLDLGGVQGTLAAQGAAQQLVKGGESATTAPCNESTTTTDNSGESKIVTLTWVIYNIPFNKPTEHLCSGSSMPVEWV
jgi:hypothetical protein